MRPLPCRPAPLIGGGLAAAIAVLANVAIAKDGKPNAQMSLAELGLIPNGYDLAREHPRTAAELLAIILDEPARRRFAAELSRGLADTLRFGIDPSPPVAAAPFPPGSAAGSPTIGPGQASLSPAPPLPAAGERDSGQPEPGLSKDSFLGEDLFWLRLGAEAAPAVYMLADPGCPHCADALAALSPRIAAGDLQVRLALAPFLSERSVDLAAMIMLEGDPAAAAWRTLLDSAAGNPPPPPPKGAAASIGEIGSALLSANLAWMRANGISAVPHFVWRESGRWRQAAGVQPPEAFSGADILAGDDLAMSAPAAILDMLPRVPEPK
ncbi:MAG: hypothetical protein OXI87_05815 [Albidovulum sp.]|nr:hypothetical protein [Albidovulum sp.]MDE0533762.1 hypothetical protein [Albidovulum sp.]